MTMVSIRNDSHIDPKCISKIIFRSYTRVSAFVTFNTIYAHCGRVTLKVYSPR